MAECMIADGVMLVYAVVHDCDHPGCADGLWHLSIYFGSLSVALHQRCDRNT
jgi:hypothetical protein